MSEVKVLRLSTGEDVVAKVDSGSEKVTLEKPFVIIPQQMGPGKHGSINDEFIQCVWEG